MPEGYERFARQALLEFTGEPTVGDCLGSQEEGEGVVTVRFDSALPGYPGWRWTVSLAVVDGGEPTVLETELMPGESALLAPDWVPWSDRLAEYRAAQEAAGLAAAESEDEPADDEDDVDDEDDDVVVDEDDDDSDPDDDFVDLDVDDLDVDDLDVDGLDVDGLDVDDLDIDLDAEDRDD